MRRRPRTKYTETQKAVMWERWKKGDTLHQIARLFDRPHTSIRQVLAETGGFRPPERRRSKTALTLAEREEISPRLTLHGHWIICGNALRLLPGLSHVLVDLTERSVPN